MIIDLWARKWSIPEEAMNELYECYYHLFDDHPLEQSESDVQNSVRLEASQAGVTLFRNNVGALHTDDGRFIRFGLANESKAMNDSIKSSDLIGIRPILITEQHLGLRIGQFVAREVKHGQWSYKGTDREKAQLKFIKLIAASGGDACFVTGKGTI